MTLSDRDILELNELSNAIIEGTLTGAQRARLEQLMAESDDARRYYVKSADLSASLAHYAGEMQIEAADAPRPLARFLGSKSVRLGTLAAAVALACFFWATRRGEPVKVAESAPTVAPTEYVARLTGAKDIGWDMNSTGPAAGGFVRRGQRLKLASGFAEITFDSGAVILLEAPAIFDVNSAWDATLRRGTIKANVPSQALGFRISNSAVEVRDLGTEFSMVANEQGTAEVFVLRGEVEAMPRGSEDSETILLHANESRRFASSGVSGTDDHEHMLAQFNTPVPLEHLSEPVKYVHWSFDDLQGKTIQATSVAGFSKADFGLRVLARSSAVRSAANTPGYRNRALHFSGNVAGRVSLPGVSGDFPRTIAFWVKVPANAALSTAYSMVAWRGDSEKLASRPVHIGWNRNPNEGPLGAVRTDFSGGHAIGTTPLRDDRWHFVTVIFLVGDDPEAPVQVKQYIDGRLESNTVTPGTKRSIGGNTNLAKSSSIKDQLWLGCRLGGSGPRQERFLGDIDELVIVDRGLEPAELVELMDGRLIAAAP